MGRAGHGLGRPSDISRQRKGPAHKQRSAVRAGFCSINKIKFLLRKALLVLLLPDGALLGRLVVSYASLLVKL
jgi:hypothetical protein